MISYLDKNAGLAPWHYTKGFKAVNTIEIARIAKCASKYCWSPIVWKGGHRLAKNFISASHLALDFDDGSLTLKKAVDHFKGYQHIIGTTRNHQKPKHDVICDRFRVIIPFDGIVTDLELYKYTMYLALKEYPGADPVAKDGARFFFPCQEIIQSCISGFSYETPTKVPEKIQLEESILNPLSARYALGKFRKNYKSGFRNNTIYGVSRDLRRLGYSAEQILDIILKLVLEAKDVPAPPENHIRARVLGAVDSLK